MYTVLSPLYFRLGSNDTGSHLTPDSYHFGGKRLWLGQKMTAKKRSVRRRWFSLHWTTAARMPNLAKWVTISRPHSAPNWHPTSFPTTNRRSSVRAAYQPPVVQKPVSQAAWTSFTTSRLCAASWTVSEPTKSSNWSMSLAKILERNPRPPLSTVPHADIITSTAGEYKSIAGQRETGLM